MLGGDFSLKTSGQEETGEIWSPHERQHPVVFAARFNMLGIVCASRDSCFLLEVLQHC
jgi:hypothetical protein